jgi:hypothetical protein
MVRLLCFDVHRKLNYTEARGAELGGWWKHIVAALLACLRRRAGEVRG